MNDCNENKILCICGVLDPKACTHHLSNVTPKGALFDPINIYSPYIKRVQIDSLRRPEKTIYLIYLDKEQDFIILEDRQYLFRLDNAKEHMIKLDCGYEDYDKLADGKFIIKVNLRPTDKEGMRSSSRCKELLDISDVYSSVCFDNGSYYVYRKEALSCNGRAAIQLTGRQQSVNSDDSGRRRGPFKADDGDNDVFFLGHRRIMDRGGGPELDQIVPDYSSTGGVRRQEDSSRRLMRTPTNRSTYQNIPTPSSSSWPTSSSGSSGGGRGDDGDTGNGGVRYLQDAGRQSYKRKRVIEDLHHNNNNLIITKRQE